MTPPGGWSNPGRETEHLQVAQGRPHDGNSMKVEVYSDADSVARKAAKLVAAEARAAVAARGTFVMAVSGGHTPWQMLRALASEDVPWDGGARRAGG